MCARADTYIHLAGQLCMHGVTELRTHRTPSTTKSPRQDLRIYYYSSTVSSKGKRRATPDGSSFMHITMHLYSIIDISRPFWGKCGITIIIRQFIVEHKCGSLGIYGHYTTRRTAGPYCTSVHPESGTSARILYTYVYTYTGNPFRGRG